jgi:hypothetical protein
MTPTADNQQLIPLVVGVTGHRDLRPQDIAALREHVVNFFAELQSTLPSTPICLLSALADGADRLVAEVALERKIQLLVPLPAEQKLYESTFLSPESIAPFHALLAQATAVWVVPECETPADEHQSEVEDWQYAAAGAYLVRYSQILLALWDGRRLDKVGGTSDIVHFALEGVPQAYAGPESLLAAPHTAQVVQIATPRQSHDPEKVPRISRQIVWPTPVQLETKVPGKSPIGKAEKLLNEYNRDAHQYTGPLTELRQQGRRYVLPDEVVTSLSRTEKLLLDAYATADALALTYQRRLIFRLRLITFITLVALVAFQLYFTLPDQIREVLIAYIGLAIVAFAVHYLTVWQRFESKYLDYRALAEGLRVQLFWRMAGLRDSVADNYLHRQLGELSWIREALKNRLLLLFHIPTQSMEIDRQLELVDKHWVQDQLNYFQRAALANANRVYRLKLLAKLCIVTGLGLSVRKVFLGNPAIDVAIVMLPILAAMMTVYIRTRKFQEQSRQFSRMALLFRHAATRLKQAFQRNDTKQAQKLVLELGQEALIENADWVILHRDRPLEGPNVL